MDLSVPADEDPNFVIEVKKVDCFKLIKNPIKCDNYRVAAITGIYGSLNREIHINADYLPTNYLATSTPMDTILNNALNIEDYEDEEKYTNGWDMMRLDDKIDNFAVNSTIHFDDVSLLEVFSQEEDEGKDYWNMSMDI